MILNHNDVHRLNIMRSNIDKEMMILDHEYAGLNLIGSDIVNYLIEMNFDYTLRVFPYYSFSKEEIDFDWCYEIYMQYVKVFKMNREDEINSNEEYAMKFEKIVKYKYFLRLICVVNLFWFLWAMIYFDEEKFQMQNSFDHFSFALDRLFLFNKANDELNSY